MEIILNNLLAELGPLYKQSDIARYCLNENHEWHYSLITTTMKKGGPLILGFNWGATQNEKYSPQASIKPAVFKGSDVAPFLAYFHIVKNILVMTS